MILRIDRAKSLATLLLASVSAAPLLAQDAGGRASLGSVVRLAPSEADQTITFDLGDGDGVIIDLTAVTAPDATPTAIPALRILDPQQACIRAIPAWDACPTAQFSPSVENAAGGGTTRAAMRAQQAGSYSLVLRLPPDEQVEYYELLVRERPLPQPAQTVEAQLCDRPLPEGTGASDPCARTFSLTEGGRDYYRFDVSEPGQWVQVDLRSTLFDTVVELLGPVPPGAPVEAAGSVGFDDDGGGGTDSRLRMRLPNPGRYVVMARSYSGGAGNYTLAIRQLAPPPPRPIERLAMGRPLERFFESGATDPYHVYELSGTAGETVVIDMTSTLDTLLDAGFTTDIVDLATLTQSNFAIVARNDDTCGLNPQLRLRFGADGRILIRASILSQVGEGAYRIEARPGDATGCPADSGQTQLPG